MKKSITAAAIDPATIDLAAIVEDARQEVGASFERFCLTAGIATLAGMMEEGAVRLCGRRYRREANKPTYRWGRTWEKLGFHGGKVAAERQRVRARVGSEMPLSSWEAALSEDWLGRSAPNLMPINVSAHKFGRAERLIHNLARRLEHDAPGVSGGIFESLDKILTVVRLGLPAEPRRALACTNIRVCRNVKRWRDAAMALRWTSAATLEAAKDFRRLKAHRQLPVLRVALAAHQARHFNLLEQNPEAA